MKHSFFINLSSLVQIMFLSMVVSLTLFGEPTVGFCQSTPPATFIENGNIYPAYYSLKWMDEKLTGDDKPYLAMRTQIEKSSASKTLTPTLVAGYKARYLNKPRDPKLFYRWAFSLYKMPEKDTRKWLQEVRHLSMDYFWKIPSPRTYQYARLRWLVQTVLGPQTGLDKPKIEAFGKRLLQRDPNDFSVLYRMINYVPLKQSVLYAEKLVQLEPNRYSAVATLTDMRFQQFLASHSQRDADRAIAAQQKLMVRFPNMGKDARYNANRTISHIRKVRARWANKVL